MASKLHKSSHSSCAQPLPLHQPETVTVPVFSHFKSQNQESAVMKFQLVIVAVFCLLAGCMAAEAEQQQQAQAVETADKPAAVEAQPVEENAEQTEEVAEADEPVQEEEAADDEEEAEAEDATGEEDEEVEEPEQVEDGVDDVEELDEEPAEDAAYDVPAEEPVAAESNEPAAAEGEQQQQQEQVEAPAA